MFGSTEKRFVQPQALITPGPGLYKPERSITILSKKNETIGSCRLIFKSKNGTYYFATSTGGMFTFKEKDNRISIIPYKFNLQLKNLSKDYITSVYQINKNLGWLLTSLKE